jgi:hypothetical protein
LKVFWSLLERTLTSESIFEKGIVGSEIVTYYELDYGY